MADNAPSHPRIFTDAEAVIAGASAASALCSHILDSANELQNDAQVREYADAGVEALMYVFEQLREPTGLETRLRLCLSQWSELQGRRRDVELRELARANSEVA